MEKSAEQRKKEENKLKEVTYEMAFNNTAAVRVLFDVVVSNGLITEAEFNKLVRAEAEVVREEMYKRVEDAGKM